MGFIFSVITAVVIAAAAGGAGNTTYAGDEISAPEPIITSDKGDEVPCSAPCTYDAATETYSCPC